LVENTVSETISVLFALTLPFAASAIHISASRTEMEVASCRAEDAGFHVG
jgi:hypothetical protein